MTNQKNIRSPAEMQNLLPTNELQKEFIKKSRDQINNILNDNDPRILLIVGPCSIHNPKSALEYAKKLQSLAIDVADTFLIVMRVYLEKPRTKSGWKGLVYDPHMDGSYDIENGLYQSRKLLIDLTDLKIPAATEFLDPSVQHYFNDLISWGCIGARTAESQTHRQLASSLNLPISFKNGTNGNVDIAVNGIISASLPHTFLGTNEQGLISVIKTKGNPSCHVTLRGSYKKPNYDPESICKALSDLEKAKLPKRLLVDCSHGNSDRNPQKQCVVFQSIIHQIIEGNKNIKGMILESELHSGNQSIPADLSKLQYGVSVTDPCIDFQTTETLIRWASERLQKNETILNKAVLNPC